MKAFGREKKVKGSWWKKDHHPKIDKKKRIFKIKSLNWWEYLNNVVSRHTMKQNIQHEVNEEIVNKK